jgi:hypothetical protein
MDNDNNTAPAVSTHVGVDVAKLTLGVALGGDDTNVRSFANDPAGESPLASGDS